MGGKGHQIQGQKILLEDLAGGGLLGPVSRGTGSSVIWILSAQC